ncbi:hypothetical protein [Achromobacter arsenitoxydans]|uniref:Phage protein n=1 Tax=Achromobacter arsenitoxydans SY8 TaxID=477184 RepID=H0FAE8_9BURK|nr:hypothetical protein [Achromobacter arsenitoxydans]EHK64779.1 phage protein [Achromobacter arsenitoxydans SY8]
MTTPYVLAGATVALCPDVPAALDAAGFGVLAFRHVRGVRVVGALALQYQTAAYQPIGAKVSILRRVARAPQSLQLDLYRITDAGQVLLRTAASEDRQYSFRIDVPQIGPHYFVAKVSSRSLSGGAGSDLASLSVTLELESAVIEPA